MPKSFISGNEAIAYAIIEAGGKVITGYPGTPSTEIIETVVSLLKGFSSLAVTKNFPHVEWSTNEKVALEVAAAASFSGLRSAVIMKNVGLNVTLDFLMTLNLTGTNGGLVIVSADDISAAVSQNQQDTRVIGYLAHIPVLEPANAQEAKNMVEAAFDLSENWGIPIIIRTTAKVSLSCEEVHVKAVEEKTFSDSYGDFVRPERFFLVDQSVKKGHENLHSVLLQAERVFGRSPFARIERARSRRPKVGVVTCGYVYNNVKEAIALLQLEKDVKVLKLGSPWPIPKEKILQFTEDCETVLVVEEIEPLIELNIQGILETAGLCRKVKGRLNGVFPWSGEIGVSQIYTFFTKYFRKDHSEASAVKEEILCNPSSPKFCAGCPHRPALFALKNVVDGQTSKTVYTSDIGCYGLSAFPPLNLGDTGMCMGSSLGLACGFSHSLSKDTLIVSSIGDSTFLHSGIPALIDIVQTGAIVLVLIHDNGVSAMTGGQLTPHSFNHENNKTVKLEKICRGCGVKNVRVVNPFQVQKAEQAIRDAVLSKKTSAIIFRGGCALKNEKRKPAKIDSSKCHSCRRCIDQFGCPAILVKENIQVQINNELCTGCGACVDVCPFEAIKG